MLYRLLKPLAEADPALFIRACLTDPSGNPIELAPVHERLQQFLTDNARALVELPRDHGKSFQVCGRVLWELGRNPALRVKIVCATDSVAAERGRFLRDAIANNVRVRLVFPHLTPGAPWAADAFTVARPADVIGPSVAAFGIGAGSTGTRADLLVCDDVVDVRSLHSRAERDRVADYFSNNLMNLLEPDGRFWGLFTPWHLDDLNERLKRNPAYKHFRAAVGADFEPVWSEKWPADRLKLRKEEIGSASFARGYRLVPAAEEDTPIRAAWVQFWTEPAECETVILSVDPAVSTATTADRSALVVLGKVSATSRDLSSPSPRVSGERVAESSRPGEGGLTSATEIRVLACTARRVATPELVGLIEEFDRVWNPSVILFETNGAFRGIRDLLVHHTRFGPKLKSVTQTADKAARVAALSVVNGRFRLKGNDRRPPGPHAAQRELWEEMVTFPFADRDDLVDAAAMGCAWLLDRREPRVW